MLKVGYIISLFRIPHKIIERNNQMSEYILETKNLVKNFGNFTAIDNVNLKVKKQSIYGLIGDNGAGKSTIMRMISGLSNKSSGNIELFGNNVKKNSSYFSKVGNLIETPALYMQLTAYDNLKLKCLSYDIENEMYIKEILKIVGLENCYNKQVKSFSLGMKQRLGIAMALIGSPEIIILDEPINGLDPQGIVDIRNMLKEINKKYGITIIISSHILEELSKIATDFGVISKGKLLAEFTIEDLHKKCRSRIEIITSNTNEVSKILNKNGYENEIINSKKVILNDYFDKISLINSLLVNCGIEISSISVKEMSFEDYYMEMLR